ncbi:hypothetical protein RRF57_002692 [Xylaria bambusicola]|uniref:Uncharacterized protein n=1 Tax=Xylaria bambusicola TaxID=326684 RepID=A0AAN7Z2P8_9PEZI
MPNRNRNRNQIEPDQPITFPACLNGMRNDDDNDDMGMWSGGTLMQGISALRVSMQYESLDVVMCRKTRAEWKETNAKKKSTGLPLLNMMKASGIKLSGRTK